jgi:hypothetical protein
MDHYDKALSHLFDVEAKAQFFKRRFGKHPNIRIHEVCLEQVTSSVDAARRFLVSIGLEPTPASDFVLTSEQTTTLVSTRRTVRDHQCDLHTAAYRRVCGALSRATCGCQWLPHS